MRQSKRIAINTVSSWLGMFANAAILIFLTKFLLSKLGTSSYGMFRYVISIQELLVILDLGLGATLNRFVSQLSAKGKAEELNEVISAIFLFFIGLGLLGGAIVCSLAFALPSLVEGGTPDMYGSGLILMFCIGGTLTVRFLGYAPRGVLFGFQRYDIVNVLQCVAAVLRAIAIAVFLWGRKSGNLEIIGLCYLASAVFETSLQWLFSKRQYPKMKLRFSNISKEVVSEVFGFSVFVTVVGITTMLMAQIPTLLAGKFYGSEAVAFLSLPILVLGQLQRLSGGFAFTLIPVAGKYRAQENDQMLRTMMQKGTRLCALICFPVGALAVVFGHPLFEWFKEGFGWTWLLLATLMVPYLIRTTQRVPFSILMGAGSVKWLSLAQTMTIGMIVFLSWLFGQYFHMGLHGVVLGAAIPIAFLSMIFQPIYACHQLGLKWKSYLIQSYGAVVLCLIPTLVAAIFLVYRMYPTNLVTIALQFLICIGVFFLMAWWFVLAVDERRQVLNVLGIGKGSWATSQRRSG